MFNGLSSLKKLDLANNGLTSSGSTALPNGVFTPLTSLESLALSGNAGALWSVAQLKTLGVRTVDPNDSTTDIAVNVIQVVSPPTGFTVAPVSGGVKLTWDDPDDTNISHQYRYVVNDSGNWSAWTAISKPTDNGATLEHTVTSDMTNGNSYFFQLRSVTSGANSWRANADCAAIFGTSGNDTLTGTRDPDCIFDLAGNDTLKGSHGAYKMDGGAGTDTASYIDSPGSVEVDLSISTGQAAPGDNHSDGDVLSNIENIRGSDYPDTLTGDSNANNIRGGNGDDTVEGGDGGDTLWGEGGTGDTLSYASSDAAVTVNIAAKTASGGHAQGDTGLGGFENLIGSAHDDTLTGTSSANEIEGGAGDDTISGGGGNDVIEGGAGSDTMTGGSGTDTLSYRNSALPMYANFADDEYEDNDAEGDTVSGFENIIGSKGGDGLVGDANDNVIEGLAGKDELDGKAGSDTVSYASSDDSVVVNFAGGNFSNKDASHLLTVRRGERVGGGGHAEGDVIENFENAIGSDYPDWFIINAAGSEIDGGDSIDDGKSTIYFPEADTWNHSRGDDGIHHMQEFYHSLGDVVDYRKSSAAVTANLTTGTNTGGSAQGDTLTGIESIGGSEHADTLTGDANNNTFFGGAGADTFDGKGGTDVVDYSWFHTTQTVGPKTVVLTLDLKTPSNNTYHAEGDTFTNIEWIIGSQYNDRITGGDGNDGLSGGAGGDGLWGGDGDDILWGPDPRILRGQPGTMSDSYDELRGGAGNDRIIIGADAAWGEAGNDKFLAMASGWLDGGDGTDEFYFHRNYFPAPAKNAGAAKILNYDDNEKIGICMGSGKGTGDGEISWTTAVEHIYGLPTSPHETVVTVSLTNGTDALNQGTFMVADFPDSSKVNIVWSDPAAKDGTGCDFDLGEVPGQTRMIRADGSTLIVPE